MSDPGEMRASDAEREQVVERLREASVEGRLTLAELTERTEAAYLARTHAELAQLTTDLPGGAPAPGPTPGPGPQPVKPMGKVRTWVVAVMGDAKRNGTWRIDQEIGAVSVMGDVTLDLREAEVRTPEVEITATCVMGDLKIIVPDGVDVQLSGVAIMGDKKVQVVEAPAGQNAPVVKVKAFVLMGDVKIIGDSLATPIKRGWFAWSEWWWDRRKEGRHQIHRDIRQSIEMGRQAHREMMQAHRDAQREFRHGFRDAMRGEREVRRQMMRDDQEARRESRREERDAWREGRQGDPPPSAPY
ncbi:DUF1707 SHOCT-like domain-containing protein [Planotetraspora kaengkrachanensis]|uniref:DUF1707 SHOCT-like domain-containing protein n=1 Tax=Planotetraspora kaengkrachanensis TaxID=575193 RepID=UPI0019459D61|nr:DUF1707 domain-containing protein [Planotetraspora kaengkrachanensis]